MDASGKRLLSAIAGVTFLLLAGPNSQAADKAADPIAFSASAGASVPASRPEIKAGQIHTTAAPTIRVTAPINENKRATLYGHVPNALKHAVDMGRVDPSTPSEHMVMVLKSSDEQKHELRRILDEQQDKRTANYHQWVTPEQFGQYFGVHDDDIAKVSAWLQSHGFQVEDVSKSKRVLHFSGVTGQLEKAFKTEIHSFQAGGEIHVSNNSEISVPEALKPVIAGVTMNNFFRKNRMTPIKKEKAFLQGPHVYGGACTTGAESSCNEFVGPGDFATIFNTAPLISQGINGTGIKIGIVGRSDILLSDVVSYRQIFGLPDNDPIFIHAGQDNGVEPGDDGESDLDVEISGGYAPNAQVYFVIGTPTYLVDGITASFEYLIENNLTDVISSSYGDCESNEGTGGNEFNEQAFEQAAAQGISVFIANGDGGPAQCDDQGGDAYEVLGYAAPAEGSSPYAVAVGGTAFNEGASTTPSATTPADNAPYWSVSSLSNENNNALSYIPEIPWNGAKNSDASLDPAADLEDLWSASGAVSAYYVQPSWQRGSNVPTSDPTLAGGNWATGLSLTNAGSGYTKNPTVTVTGGGCITEPAITATYASATGSIASLTFNYGTQGGSLKGGQGFGCTSTPTFTIAAPTGTPAVTATGVITGIGPMQNILPLISGVPHRYTPDLSLAAEVEHDGTVFCSEGGCESPGGGQFYFDIVGGTSVAAPSMAGIQALIDQANGGRQGMPGYIYYALSAAQSETTCNSQVQPTVAASSTNASGVTSSCAFQDVTVGDNLICGTSACSSSAQKIGFEAGPGFDLATGLGSVNAYNLATQWDTVTFNSTDTTVNLSQSSGLAHGQTVTISGTVAPGSGAGTPTGDVAFILSQGAFGQTVNVSSQAWNGPAPFATLSSGNYSATISNLPAGTYQLTARYGGDSTFASSLSAPVTVTVGSENSTVTITPQSISSNGGTITPATTFTYDGLADIEATVAGISGQGVPTGTVSFTVDGSPWVTETLDPNGNGYLIEGALSSSSEIYDYMFATAPAIPAGTHSIGATYSGDSTFNAVSATPVSITISPLTVTPTLVVAPTTNLASGATTQLTASFALSALTTGGNPLATAPTGTISFYEGGTSGTLLGMATLVPVVTYVQPPDSGSYPSYTYSAYAVTSTTLITASGSITAVYNGDTNYTAATSAATAVTVASAPATTVTVTSSANPTTLGGAPTFTATIAFVAGGTAPTAGTVAWYDGSFLLGTSSVGSSHTATEKISITSTTHPFNAGTHIITASYEGTSTTAGPSTGTFTETVNQTPITITLTGKTEGLATSKYSYAAVLNCAGSGTAATAACAYYSSYGEYFFNADFSPNQNPVSFYDGTTLLGTATATTVTLEQGGYGAFTAQLTGLTLAAGTHTITAQYADTNYSAATSNAQTVKVYGSPLGNLETAIDASTGSTTVESNDSIYINGWAADPTDGAPVTSVVLYIDGTAITAPTMGISRPDVASAYNNSAYTNSGFTLYYPAASLTAGSHTITAVATNGGGVKTTLGPLHINVNVVIVYPAPIGNLETAVDSSTSSTTVKSSDSIYINGWIADPTDGSPMTNVHVLIDGVSIGTPTLGISRPDVASAYNNPAYANSGFTMNYSAAQLSVGSHSITVVGTDSHSVSTTLGPLAINVVHPSVPVGSLDSAVDASTGSSTISLSSGDSLYVGGWAADYTDNGPAKSVQIYIDGVSFAAATLGISRPDVAAYYNNSAWTNSGYQLFTSVAGLSQGSHSVTAVAKDSLGDTTTLGPLTFTVAP
jgi:hypothetical protein